MLSRVAERLFWTTRYIERAENIARFLEVNQNLVLDAKRPSDRSRWQPLIDTTGDAAEFADRYGECSAASVKQFLIFDREYLNSIVTCLSAARENARQIRETISQPMWEEINTFYLYMRQIAENDDLRRKALESPTETLKDVRRHSHTLHGMTNATMSHDEAFHVARLGRLLERAEKTSRILDVRFGQIEQDGSSSPVRDTTELTALLKSASALHMYRRAHGSITLRGVSEFLLRNKSFPRSIRSCLTEADRSLHEVSGTHKNDYGSQSEQLLGQLRSDLEFTDPDTFFGDSRHEAIDRFQTRLNEIGQAIGRDLFMLRPREEMQQTMSRQSGRMRQSLGGMSQSMRSSGSR